jgi:hypothetical protein
VLLSDAEWAALRRAMVSTLRIDDHPVWHGWTTRHPDGTDAHVEYEIPASPVPVPVAALKDGRSFAD